MTRRRDSSQDKQERVSRKQFGEYLEQNEWITADIVPDKGEDILVRIYDKEKSTGLSLYIQLKSVQIVESLKLKSGAISYSFEVADLEHWENQNPPVLLVVWDVSDRRGWWAWTSDAVKILDKKNAGWRSKSKVQVHFPPKNSLDKGGLDKIRHKLADLYYLVISKDNPLNIQTKFVFLQTPEGRAKLAEFERHIAFGDEIELDGRFIEQFELPEWWRRIYGEIEPKTMYLKIGPTKSAETHPVQLDFFSPGSGSERIPYVEFRAVKQGQEEITLSNEHQSIDPKITLRINYKTRECNITFNFQYYQVDPLTLLQMLRIHKILTKGCTVRITLLKTGSFDLPTVPPATIPAPPDKLIKYAENLVAIQQCSGRVLKLTDEASFSFENVVNAEELLSIYHSGSHKQNRLIFTIELRRPDIEQIVEAHKKGESLYFRLITEESYIELLGEHFDLGPMTQYITGRWEMPVEEVLAWLEKADEDDALQVRLVDAELYEEFENWMREKPFS